MARPLRQHPHHDDVGLEADSEVNIIPMAEKLRATRSLLVTRLRTGCF